MSNVGGTDAPPPGGGLGRGTIGRYRTWGRQAPGGGASHHQLVPHLGTAPAPGGGALTCAASVLARDRRGTADSGALHCKPCRRMPPVHLKSFRSPRSRHVPWGAYARPASHRTAKSAFFSAGPRWDFSVTRGVSRAQNKLWGPLLWQPMYPTLSYNMSKCSD